MGNGGKGKVMWEEGPGLRWVREWEAIGQFSKQETIPRRKT